MNLSRITPKFPITAGSTVYIQFPLPEIPGRGIELHQLRVFGAGAFTSLASKLIVEFGLTHNLAQSGARPSRDDAVYGLFFYQVEQNTIVGFQDYRLSWEVDLKGFLVGGTQKFMMFWEGGDDPQQFKAELYWDFRVMPELEWRALHQRTVIGSGGTQVPG